MGTQWPVGKRLTWGLRVATLLMLRGRGTLGFDALKHTEVSMTDYRRSRAGYTYFFTVVTHERRPILCTELGRACLRGAMREARASRPFETVALVLLPDHLHAAWELPRGDTDYSTRWAHIKSRFTRSWLAAGGGEGEGSASRTKRNERAVWQRRFYEHTCRDEADLKRCVDYLHVNPVKHQVVERVRDWPWSTFHRYVRLGEYSLDWGNSTAWYGDEFVDFE